MPVAALPITGWSWPFPTDSSALGPPATSSVQYRQTSHSILMYLITSIDLLLLAEFRLLLYAAYNIS